MELWNLAIDPDHVRRGYASRLCRQGMAMAAEDGVPVEVLAIENGVHLYKSLGFITKENITVVGSRPGLGATLDFWVMQWDLEGRRLDAKFCCNNKEEDKDKYKDGEEAEKCDK
jgi:hypothetical protein